MYLSKSEKDYQIKLILEQYAKRKLTLKTARTALKSLSEKGN